jgi:hypothetical protein
MNAVGVYGIDAVVDVALLTGRTALEVDPGRVASPGIVDAQGLVVQLGVDVLFEKQRFQLGVLSLLRAGWDAKRWKEAKEC